MTTYKIFKMFATGEDTVLYTVIIKDGIFSIPFDPDNIDYQEYLKWVAEGNEPLPPDEPETPTET